MDFYNNYINFCREYNANISRMLTIYERSLFQQEQQNNLENMSQQETRQRNRTQERTTQRTTQGTSEGTSEGTQQPNSFNSNREGTYTNNGFNYISPYYSYPSMYYYYTIPLNMPYTNSFQSINRPFQRNRNTNTYYNSQNNRNHNNNSNSTTNNNTNRNNIFNNLSNIILHGFEDFLNPVPIYPTNEQITQATEQIQYCDISNRDITQCPIDLVNFEDNEQVLRIKHCGHIFRERNLRAWFRNSPRCPICRYDIRDYTNSTNTTNPNIERNNNETQRNERETDNTNSDINQDNIDPYNHNDNNNDDNDNSQADNIEDTYSNNISRFTHENENIHTEETKDEENNETSQQNDRHLTNDPFYRQTSPTYTTYTTSSNVTSRERETNSQDQLRNNPNNSMRTLFNTLRNNLNSSLNSNNLIHNRQQIQDGSNNLIDLEYYIYSLYR